MKKALVAALGGIAIVGCAGRPPPNSQIAASKAAVRGAAEVGAREVPEAELHLKLAEDQLAQAEKLMEDGENERAEDRALRAYQDAELALALTREHAAKQRLSQYAQQTQGAAGGERPPMQQPSTTQPGGTQMPSQAQ